MSRDLVQGNSPAIAAPASGAGAERKGCRLPARPSTGCACPACGSSNLSLLSDVPVPQRAGEFFPDTFRLVVCSTCGLWSKEQIPNAETLESHYRAIAVSGSPWNYNTRWPHERRIDRMLHALPRGARVLDVGCWTGRLLAPHASRLDVCGVEPNPDAAAEASARGLKVLAGDAADLPVDAGLFDRIILVDVFEHLREPMVVLRRLLDLVAPGGSLVLVTGRTDCFPVRVAGPSYWYFTCPDHLVFLNRRFTSWLADALGGVRVSYAPLRHFDLKLRKLVFEALWLPAWRFLSPHSPFPPNLLQRLPGAARFARLREPLVCGAWRDHALVEIRKWKS